jgi:hypothetical protein
VRGRWFWLAGVSVCMGVVLLGVAYEMSFAIRGPVRWALGRAEFKAQMERLPEPPKGELKHLDWDGWGFAGMGTEVYLVFDPTDSLAGAAASHRAEKVPGVPCKFDRARRLEKNWYAVVYFTDQSWSVCTY